MLHRDSVVHLKDHISEEEAAVEHNPQDQEHFQLRWGDMKKGCKRLETESSPTAEKQRTRALDASFI